jgi:hypothetical protein
VSKGKEAARKVSEAIVKSIFPDWCWTPLGPGTMVPVPYQITAKLDLSISTVRSVRMKAFEAFTMYSRVTQCTGDELGIGGGLLSGVNRGFCRPATYCKTVRAGKNKSWMIHHQSMFWMNCNGPEGQWNTIGMLVYIKLDGFWELEQTITPQDMYNALGTMVNSQTDRGFWNNVSPQFEKRLREISAEVGADPNHLMAAMQFETGGSFGANVWQLGEMQAVGLIQFIPKWLPQSSRDMLGTNYPDLRGVPFKDKQWTDAMRQNDYQLIREQLARMSPETQLEFVRNHMMQYKDKLSSVEDVYMAIHQPAGVGKPGDWAIYSRTMDKPLLKDFKTRQEFDAAMKKYKRTPYGGNEGLDKDGDGKVTKDEAAEPVRKRLQAQLAIEAANAGVKVKK